MGRNNGVKMGEVICEGTGGSRRPERRYRKGRRKGGGKWREFSLVTRLKSGSLEVSMLIWPPFLTRLADVAIIRGVFALSTPVMEEKKICGMWGLVSSCDKKKSWCVTLFVDVCVFLRIIRAQGWRVRVFKGNRGVKATEEVSSERKLALN